MPCCPSWMWATTDLTTVWSFFVILAPTASRFATPSRSSRGRYRRRQGPAPCSSIPSVAPCHPSRWPGCTGGSAARGGGGSWAPPVLFGYFTHREQGRRGSKKITGGPLGRKGGGEPRGGW